jgi:hypothetical protein
MIAVDRHGAHFRARLTALYSATLRLGSRRRGRLARALGSHSKNKMR